MLSREASHQRRFSCFLLNALVIVEMNILVNSAICLCKGFQLAPIDTFLPAAIAFSVACISASNALISSEMPHETSIVMPIFRAELSSFCPSAAAFCAAVKTPRDLLYPLIDASAPFMDLRYFCRPPSASRKAFEYSLHLLASYIAVL